MEAAIDVLARRLGVAGARMAPSRRFAFDPSRRRESAIVGHDLFCKGAPEAVLPLCSDVDGPVADQVQAMASRGLRVLAVARRRLDGPSADWESRPAGDIECGMELLGLIGLHDPPRPDVGDVIRTARKAGLKLAMITGDFDASLFAHSSTAV